MRNAALTLASLIPAIVGLSIPTDDQMRFGLAPDVPDSFTVDLQERRLIQFSPEEPAVWMTELDKVRVPCRLERVH